MLRKWSRGQGLTEFAIILPVLLLTIFLIVESGRIFQAYVTVQNAAREGARYAVTGQGGDDRVNNVKQAAKDSLAAGLPLADCDNYWCEDDSEPEGYRIIVWSGSGYDNAGLPGQRVQVEVIYNVRIITPLLSTTARIVPVTGRVEMINEPFGATGLGQGGVVPPELGVPDTPTPTSTPMPLTINEPLQPGDTVVTGSGDARGLPLVQIYDWLDELGDPIWVLDELGEPIGRKLIGTGNIEPTGAFRITGLPPLIAEHTIRAVAAYGSYDDAVVLPETGSGSISVQKIVFNGADPTAWAFTVLHPDGTSEALLTGGTLPDLPLGRYTITESGPPGWHLESVTGAGCTRVGDSAVVILGTGGQLTTCTFTNAEDTGSITIYKSVPEGADPNQWEFTVTGPEGSNTGLLSGSRIDGLSLGSYTISEPTVEGWYLESVQGCTPLSGSSASTEITTDGQSIVCTFTNKPYAASITLEKSTDGLDADSTPGPYKLIGDDVTWEYKVTNTGQFTLTNVTVTDDQLGAVTCPEDTLSAGAFITCTASGPAVAGQYENWSSASGQYLATPVSDEDPSHYFGVEPPDEGTWLVNCGDNEDYVDESRTWKIDPPYAPGSWGYLGDLTRTDHTHGACSGLTDLLNSYDAGQFFGFQFDNFLPGLYEVTLYFVEPSFSAVGSRIFDVAIEDRMVLNDFDILAQFPPEEEGQCVPISRTEDVVVLDGQLNIDLSGETVGDRPIISAIEIQYEDVPPAPTVTPTPTETPIPTQTPLPTPIRLPDLTITGLSVPSGDPVPAWTPVAITTDLLNDSTGPCSEFFWTDLYVFTDTVQAPEIGRPGLAWKGLSGLDAYAETRLTFDHTFTVSGTHYLYSQVDSFDLVLEEDEANNISQPLTMTIYYAGDTPTPTSTPDISCDGKVSGTVWAFVGGQLVVPEDRADMRLYDQSSSLIDSAVTDEEGGYRFECVPQGTGYTVVGLVDIGGVLYVGSETGIEVVAGQETGYIDVILYPTF